MPPQVNAGPDERSNSQAVRDWQKLNELKRSLVRQGVISGDATAEAVIAAIRQQVPSTLFS